MLQPGVDPFAWERKLADARWRGLLTELGIDSFAALQSRFIATPRVMRNFVGDGLVLTDDRPLVEFHRSIRAPGRSVDNDLLKPLYEYDPARDLHFVP